MKVGVVGCGSIASAHINGLIKRGINIAALCDTEIEKAERLNREFNLNAKVYGSYSKMLDEAALNSVHICTPHYLHTEMILAALDKDINVFAEKPLCIDSEDIVKLLDAERRSKAQVGVCLQNRYLDANILAKKLNESNYTSLAHCNVIWSRDGNYYKSAGWRGKQSTEGGGVLINQALHTLDLLILMMGQPKSVIAHTYNYHLKDIIEVEDTAEGYIEFENGAATFYATTAAPDNMPVEIILKGKKLIALNGGVKLSIDGLEVEQDKSKNTMGREYWGIGHDKIIKHFYDCIEAKEKFPIDVSEGAKSVKLVLGMYKSNGNKIKLS